jgi:ABC-2 type transport system permease protein
MRCVRRFGAIFSLSLRRSLTFRLNLVFELVVSVLGIGAGLAALALVFEQTSSLGGWSRGEAIVLLGTYQIVSGVLWTFIEPNVAWFQNQVTAGKLDDILLQPAPSIFLASLGSCSPLSLSQVITGGIVLAVGLRDLGNSPGGVEVVAWLVLLVVGIALTWASRVLVASLAFWAPALSQDVLYSALWQFGRYPVSIYRQPIRFALTWIVPLALVATLPARMLTHGPDPVPLVAGPLAAIGVVVVVNVVWRAGLRRYTSATS